MPASATWNNVLATTCYVLRPRVAVPKHHARASVSTRGSEEMVEADAVVMRRVAVTGRGVRSSSSRLNSICVWSLNPSPETTSSVTQKADV